MKEWHVGIAKCSAMCAKCDPKLHEIIQVGLQGYCLNEL